MVCHEAIDFGVAMFIANMPLSIAEKPHPDLAHMKIVEGIFSKNIFNINSILWNCENHFLK